MSRSGGGCDGVRRENLLKHDKLHRGFFPSSQSCNGFGGANSRSPGRVTAAVVRQWRRLPSVGGRNPFRQTSPEAEQLSERSNGAGGGEKTGGSARSEPSNVASGTGSCSAPARCANSCTLSLAAGTELVNLWRQRPLQRSRAGGKLSAIASGCNSRRILQLFCLAEVNAIGGVGANNFASSWRRLSSSPPFLSPESNSLISRARRTFHCTKGAASPRARQVGAPQREPCNLILRDSSPATPGNLTAAMIALKVRTRRAPGERLFRSRLVNIQIVFAPGGNGERTGNTIATSLFAQSGLIGLTDSREMVPPARLKAATLFSIQVRS